MQPTFAFEEVFEQEWELIIPQTVRRQRFKTAAQKVCRLLFMRRCWARIGVWLDKNRTHTRRHLLVAAWHALRTPVSRYASLFTHVKRKNGKLVYRDRH
jgi:hypothetical protein